MTLLSSSEHRARRLIRLVDHDASTRGLDDRGGMASIEELAAALRTIATPGMKPKALRAAIRKRYPDATKKEIVRAAFHAVTETAPAAHRNVAELHEFGLAERFSGDEVDGIPTAGKRKRKYRLSHKDDDRHTRL
jgi:hypothetical protein